MLIRMIRNFRIKWLRVSLIFICTRDVVRNINISENNRNLISGIIMGGKLFPIVRTKSLKIVLYSKQHLREGANKVSIVGHEKLDYLSKLFVPKIKLFRPFQDLVFEGLCHRIISDLEEDNPNTSKRSQTE